MRRAVSSLVVLALAGTLAVSAPAGADEHVVLTDVYVEMDDGVRLAADVHLPPGTPTDGSVQVPCLVELTPYRKEGRAAEGASLLPGEGFGLIEVDARGTGGSEGEYDIVFSLREQYDGAAMVEWAATEAPYCTDKVGMYGGSYSGIIQYLVASLPADRYPTHLAAIAPQRAYGDLYRDIVYHGGQLIGSFGAIWSSATTAFYTQPPTNIATPEGQSAWMDHLTQNNPMMVPYISNPYADSTFTWTNEAGSHSQALYDDSSVLSRIENLRVPTLHLAGWFDSFTRGQLLTFQRALEAEEDGGGPNYLIVGPWNHGGTHFITPDQGFSQHLVDWYRHWLDDASPPEWFNEGRVNYYVMNEGALDDTTGEWRTADTWPLPQADLTRFYLTSGGGLSPDAQEAADSATYVYDPTHGVAETASRWDNAAIVPMANLDQRIDGERSLTFRTGPLAEDLTVAGPIAMNLWASTTGVAGDPDLAASWPGAGQLTPPYHDTDFVVKLSDVAPDGSTTLITAGYLRASHRAVDLDRSVVVDGEVVSPYHEHTLASLDPPTPGELREYLIEIWPTAKTFGAGHELRIDVYSADTPNHLTLLKPAVNTVSLGAEQPSSVLLPVIP